MIFYTIFLYWLITATIFVLYALKNIDGIKKQFPILSSIPYDRLNLAIIIGGFLTGWLFVPSQFIFLPLYIRLLIYYIKIRLIIRFLRLRIFFLLGRMGIIKVNPDLDLARIMKISILTFLDIHKFANNNDEKEKTGQDTNSVSDHGPTKAI